VAVAVVESAGLASFVAALLQAAKNAMQEMKSNFFIEKVFLVNK
jgi:hypothetical protein